MNGRMAQLPVLLSMCHCYRSIYGNGEYSCEHCYSRVTENEEVEGENEEEEEEEDVNLFATTKKRRMKTVQISLSTKKTMDE